MAVGDRWGKTLSDVAEIQHSPQAALYMMNIEVAASYNHENFYAKFV